MTRPIHYRISALFITRASTGFNGNETFRHLFTRIILYEMLTGIVPFEGESAVSIAIKHFQDAVPPVRDYDPRIPQALENVVLKQLPKIRTNATVMLGNDH